MIIVEGPDGAGKTTLVRHLERKFHLKIGERGTTNRDLLWTVTRSDTYRALKLELDLDERPRIWDRLFYSEFVYWEYTNRPRAVCQFNPAETHYISEIIRAMNVPVVLCMPVYPTIHNNVINSEKHQMAGVMENLMTICSRYAQVYEDLMPPNTIVYNYEQNGIHIVEEAVGDYLATRRERIR